MILCRLPAAAAALLIAAGAAWAASLPAAPKGGGWVPTASSLLLFSSDGFLSEEIGLGEWTEDLPNGLKARRRMKGGASGDGRFAWHWQKVETLQAGRSETILGSTRTLVYLGTTGQILWSNARADAPEGVEPLYQSARGETALVMEAGPSGWSGAIVTYTGNVIERLDAGARLQRARLTPDGRFVHIVWSGADSPLIHTFYDAAKRARKDIPAEKTRLGEASIGEDGTVRSAGKILHEFP